MPTRAKLLQLIAISRDSEIEHLERVRRDGRAPNALANLERLVPAIVAKAEALADALRAAPDSIGVRRAVYQALHFGLLVSQATWTDEEGERHHRADIEVLKILGARNSELSGSKYAAQRRARKAGAARGRELSSTTAKLHASLRRRFDELRGRRPATVSNEAIHIDVADEYQVSPRTVRRALSNRAE